MATRRSLGGGRVLGSGRSLAPPVPSKPQHQRTNSLLSPSESSVSLSSQTSSTPVSTQDEDIMSKVALGDQSATAAASASSKLMCPICSEEMMTLLQLNRHLDDNHQNLEEVQQDEVKNWFDQQVEKAKKFQPLAVLNQRLKGLDVFEPNGIASPPRPASAQSPNRQASPARSTAPIPPPVARPVDPDEVVSKAHWQRSTGMDVLDGQKSEKGLNQVPVDVRMCKDCQHTVFSKADFARETSQRPPDQRAYENLIQFQRGIQLLLPKFQRLLQTLQDPERPPSPAHIAEAGKVRKRLMDAFTQYDVAARRIRDMPTESPTQEKLQKAIYLQASSFLHLHMLPLKALPKIIRHATPNGSKAAGSPLAAIKKDHTNGLTRRDSNASSSTTSTPNVAAISALEAEEKELRERLIVLEEQKFMVQEMVNEAKKKRRFDEVAALGGNVDDLSREIDNVQNRIRGMDFEGAYLGEIGG
ncbi:putative vacuolar segregation protein PEP7 [Elsinoe australis]|uniref:Putative vacuolar segregation protein PEP7 n=1 Tax=Elsinoe australis TaxID=40998 RepID=A0A4U7AT47_9PEZI|nr:putative vacuolar segregation protein PEP7 [Elsinoe australis]